ncbi:MAG: hypothetical protein ACI33P_05275 [Lysinibacillus sp.]
MYQLTIDKQVYKESEKKSLVKYIFSDMDIKSSAERADVDELIYLFKIGNGGVLHNFKCSEQISIPFISGSFTIQGIIDEKNLENPDVIYLYINNRKNLMKIINKLIPFQRPIVTAATNEDLLSILRVNNFYEYKEELLDETVYYPSFYTEADQDELFLRLSGVTAPEPKPEEAPAQKFESKVIELEVLKEISTLHKELHSLKGELVQKTSDTNMLIQSIPEQIDSLQQEKVNLTQQIHQLQEQLKKKTELEKALKEQNKQLEAKYLKAAADHTELKAQVEQQIVDKLRIVDEMDIYINETTLLVNENKYFKNKYEEMTGKFNDLQERYLLLESRYDALKNSKLGKLTLKYWGFKKKRS